MWPTLGLLLCAVLLSDGARKLNEFPPDFHFSASTSAYQVEGAWNESGKGENIWDRMTHEHPGWILDGSNGDVTCDSYHRYEEDIEALKELGMGFYRFSLSWSRLLPTGFSNVINQAGVDYYNNLIDALLSNGIEPMVTLLHFDTPQPLEDLGGWPNPLIADYFVDYADVVFRLFGDRVKWWITFNEPVHIANGYSSGPTMAPGLDMHGIADYMCADTILKAHARVYELYGERYRQEQNGSIGMSLHSSWYEPLNDTTEDQMASERALAFNLGWFMDPIFSSTGDYPPVMRERIDANSRKENRTRSRLPTFSEDWIRRIRGTWDFLGLNQYTTSLVTSGELGDDPSRSLDSGTMTTQDPSWEQASSPWLRVVPWGMRKLLNYIKDKYNNPTVFITENGVSSNGDLNDTIRTRYFSGYLSEVLLAINLDDCNVIGHTVWSLLDNFEWSRGYVDKFGLFQVNFSDPARPRTAKDSVQVMTEIIRDNAVPNRLFNKEKRNLNLPFNIGEFFPTYLHWY